MTGCEDALVAFLLDQVDAAAVDHIRTCPRCRAEQPAVRALAAALIPLPAILVFDVALVRAIYSLLGAVLPHGLSLYLVVNHAALLALLLTLTYGAVPFLAARQARLLLQDGYRHG